MKPSSANKKKYDFHLSTWGNPPRGFQFLGWRDDYSAFYLLDEQNTPFVLSLVPLGFKGLVRFDTPPTNITETRLVVPPCRITKTEANLLRDARVKFQGRVQSYPEIVQMYLDESAKLGIKTPTKPEQWELLCGDALAPDKTPCQQNEWPEIQENLQEAWCEQHKLDPQSMMDEHMEFCRRHGADHILAAQVRYRLACHNLVTVWLSGFNIKKPDSVSDLDQIVKLHSARPELVGITPTEVEKEIGLKPDASKKHRTLIKHCKHAGGLDHTKLTRADIPILKLAKAHFDDLRRAGGKRGIEEQIRAIDKEAAKYSGQ
jgi:hypothetical protein